MAKRRSLVEFRPANEQEKRFAEQYWTCLDPVQAALQAGYDKGVAQNAALMLQEPQIEAEIARIQAERSVRTHITMDRVVLELGRVGLADPADCFDAAGNLLPVAQMPEDTRRAIESIEMLPGGGARIKFASKLKALEQLAPHVQGWTPKAHKGKTRTAQQQIGDLYEILQRAQARAKGALPPSRFKATEIDSNGRRTMFEVEIDGDFPDEPEKDVTPK